MLKSKTCPSNISKTVNQNELKIGRNLIQHNGSALAKCLISRNWTLLGIVLWNLWLFLDRSALYKSRLFLFLFPDFIQIFYPDFFPDFPPDFLNGFLRISKIFFILNCNLYVNHFSVSKFFSGYFGFLNFFIVRYLF